jgi:hypothetical protein
MRYRVFNGAASDLVKTDVDCDYYDLAGTRTAVTSSKFTIQRIYQFPGSGIIVIGYGQAMYDTLQDAKENVTLEAVTINELNTLSLQGSMLRGWICIKQGTTQLSNASDCYIMKATSLLSGASAGGAGISDHALLDNLEYANSGHTGFQPSGDYLTEESDPAFLASEAANFEAGDKDKLDGIATGAEVNVQADWNEADTDADDFIKNKPSIPAGVVASDTVANETSFGITPSAGAATSFSRSDHTHGTPANPGGMSASLALAYAIAL